MENKKLNLLFDGSVFGEAYRHPSRRGRIFFALYNVLLEMMKNPRLNIEIYCNFRDRHCVEKYLESDEALSSLKIADVLNPFSAWFLDLIKGKKDKIAKWHAFYSPYGAIPGAIKGCKHIQKFTLLHDFSKPIGSLNGRDYYFTNSKYTKDNLLKFCPKVKSRKVTVTHLAASENFYECRDKVLEAGVKKKYGIPLDKKYILSVLDIEPRKNNFFTIKNFLRFIGRNGIKDTVLVLTGHQQKNFSKTLEEGLGGFRNRDNIIAIDHIDDKDLAPLYSNALCFAYNSLYEGFGLSSLEAMKCGCPTIASNLASIPEVVEDAGILIDPTSDKEYREAFEKIYFDKELREDLRQKGLERAKEFSWANCAKKMADRMFQVCFGRVVAVKFGTKIEDKVEVFLQNQ